MPTAETKEINRLKDRIEALEMQLVAVRREFGEFEIPGIENTKLTARQRVLCKLLHDARGRTVSRQTLYNAIYALMPQADWPHDKIIDVYICYIRRRLKGTRWEIRTVWGSGYSLHEVGADAR